MRVKKGQLRPSPNEEAQMIKEETEKRRKLRLKQVRLPEMRVIHYITGLQVRLPETRVIH